MLAGGRDEEEEKRRRAGEVHRWLRERQDDADFGAATGLSTSHICTHAPHDFITTDPLALQIAEWDGNGRQGIPAREWFREVVHGQAFRVCYADGGQLLEYRQPRASGLNIGGGVRGVVSCFSPESRARLLKFFASIDRRKVEPLRNWFATLTYGATWPDDPERWKKDLRAFRSRLERAFGKHWGKFGVVWKLEPQRRGAPHFHLVILVPAEWCAGMELVASYFDGRRRRRVTRWRGGMLQVFREWCSRAWAAVVSGQRWRDDRTPWPQPQGVIDHIRAGTNVEPMETYEQLTAYVGKYIGKEAEFKPRWVQQGDRVPMREHVEEGTGEVFVFDQQGEPMPQKGVGRFWGIWNEELWPVRYVTRGLGETEWVQVRRVLRRYLEKKGVDVRRRRDGLPRLQWVGWPRAMSAYVPAEVVSRLLDETCWWESCGLSHRDHLLSSLQARREFELSCEAQLYN